MSVEADSIALSFRWADIPLRQLLGSLRAARSRSKRVWNIVVWTCFWLTLLMLVQVAYGDGYRSALMLMTGPLMVLALCVFSYFQQKTAYAAMATAPHRSGVTDVRLEQEGMSYRGNAVAGSYKWAAITDVIEVKDYTLLLLSPYELFPIPDASLPVGVTPDALVARITRWRAKATA